MLDADRRRVVVTGLGAITDLGNDVGTFWDGLCSGRSGVNTISAFEQDDQWDVRIAGEVRDWDPSGVIPTSELKRMDRFSALGMVAAVEATGHCGIDFTRGNQDRRGVVIGTGIGGILTIEHGLARLFKKGSRRMSPFTVPKLMANACAGNVSIRFGLRGPNFVPATACASGGHAIAAASHLIRRGDADVIVAGGSEAAVSSLCIASFAAMKALSRRNDEPTLASRPFDRDRDGFVLAEGAAVLILEEAQFARKRGATILGEVLGFGISGDAHHIAAPDPEGRGAIQAMRWALDDAAVNLDAVDYINAHGTSTPLGDVAEVRAVKAVFGEHASSLAMCSTKSMTGHALGAAGGLESVALVKCLEEGVMVPTINLDAPDEGFDLDFVANEARQVPIRCAMNNSFGFGGHNVSILFGRYDG